MDQANKKMYNDALELYEKGEFKAALEKLKRVVKAHPDYPDILNALGLTYSMTGNYEQATESFQRAVDINPDYIEAYVNMAIVQNEQCKFEDAIKSFEKAAALETKDKGLSPQLKAKLTATYSQLGDTYYELQEFRKAKDEYIRALEISESFLDIKLKLSKTHMQLREYNDAEKLLIDILHRNKNYIEARSILGLCNYHQKKFEDAKNTGRKF